jgi:phenylpyruvate tautomerase PptA (4-oxalocrotonate tautomerase family)
LFSWSNTFNTYKNELIELSCGIDDSKVNETKKAELIDKITRFTDEKLGKSFTNKILISQEDYQRHV